VSPDLFNGAFEALGAAMLLLNVRQLWRDRRVQGVHWAPTVFFVAWGAWNLFYYPHLGQWFSFFGGLGVVLANLAWIGSLVWFSRRGRP